MGKTLNLQDIRHNIVIIKINKSYHAGMHERELYEYTRGFWKRKIESVQAAQYALAVADSQVVEVYRIERWLPASEADNRFRQYDPDKYSNRIAFDGEIAPEEIREYYLGRDVSSLYKWGEADPVKLFLMKQDEITAVDDINVPIKPRRVLLNANGTVQYECGRCGLRFKKASRCPECGQMIKTDTPIVAGNTRVLRVGDDVSRLKIYEIINKYFGKNYSGWMKAGFDINADYWAWFPTISKNNVRPDGNYGGTAMWSNTLSPDKKTVISMNHDATIDDVPANERNNDIKRKNVLIFGRINGAFEFLGVFDDKLVLEEKIMTYRHDRIAKGINLSTFELIEPD